MTGSVTRGSPLAEFGSNVISFVGDRGSRSQAAHASSRGSLLTTASPCQAMPSERTRGGDALVRALECEQAIVRHARPAAAPWNEAARAGRSPAPRGRSEQPEVAYTVCELRKRAPVVELLEQRFAVVINHRYGIGLNECNAMLNSDFGEFMRARRAVLRLSLRAFAERAGLDAGNASRMERGRTAPPEGEESLARIARALELGEGTPDYQQLIDFAALDKGRVPTDLLTDKEAAAWPPVLFRTLRKKPLSGEQFERLIDTIRSA